MGSPLQFGSGRLNLSQSSPPPGQPDLTVSGLTSSPSNPRVGDFVTVSGIVRNIGNADAGPFVIEIRDSGGTDRRTVSGLNAGGSTSFSFTRRVNQATETFTVVADATNQVNESNETNNSAELRVTATQPILKPDLAIASTDWSPRTLTVGQNVTLSVVVRNQGQANAGPFIVEVRDSAGTDRQTLSGLAVGSTATVSFTRRVNNTTEFFTIVVDATNQIDELDETNNSAQIRVDAQPQVQRKPDLTIAGVDWTPRTPRLGETINFTIVVRNQGESDAGPFIVEIRDSAGIDRRTLSGLGAASSVSIAFARRQNNATEIFTITADVTNQVDESNETNNSTQVRIEALAETRLPDLTVDSLDYSPRDPTVGSSLTLTAIVRNIGNADAGPFVVEVQDSAGTTRQSITGLRAGASVRVDFARRLNSASETFTVTADALRQISESDETNNSRQITVRASTPSQLSISISTDKTSYRIGERLQIFLRLGAQAYVYVFDVDPAGRVSQVFPNSFSRQNLLNAGTYTPARWAIYSRDHRAGGHGVSPRRRDRATCRFGAQRPAEHKLAQPRNIPRGACSPYPERRAVGDVDERVHKLPSRHYRASAKPRPQRRASRSARPIPSSISPSRSTRRARLTLTGALSVTTGTWTAMDASIARACVPRRSSAKPARIP
jgi:subtilase family serine protease